MNLALSLTDIGRFRVNIFKQRNETAMVIRNIVTEIPNKDDLGLPEVLSQIIMAKRGLILFVGGTGSGKSTSLAALIDHRNIEFKGPHRHHRGPGRIHSPAQGLHRQPARSGDGHPFFCRRPEKHAAPGTGRYPDR